MPGEVALKRLLESNMSGVAQAGPAGIKDPQQLLMAVTRSIAERIERLKAAPISAPLASWGLPHAAPPGSQQLQASPEMDSSMMASFDGTCESPCCCILLCVW